MNRLFHATKIIGFYLLISTSLTACFYACAEMDPLIECDNVTLNITNMLDHPIEELFVEGVSVGNINTGETVFNVCLESLVSDMGTYPYLHFTGIYQGQETGEEIIYCGVGMLVVNEGTFNIEINNVDNNFFYYQTI